MSEGSLPKHRQLRANLRHEDLPVRRVRAWSPPVKHAPAPAPAQAPVPAAPAPAHRPPNVVYSSHVGRFFRAKPLQQLPAVVTKGQPLGVVKALGMEFTVTAPCAGWVDAVEVDCGSPVEYGQPLVALRVSP